jgi:DHA1 family bicyclomycin/chloramphenicol resistance-like MFS transporter
MHLPAHAPTSRLAILLLALTIFGPVSMDLYLPALPALTRDLDTVSSVAQLTITACLVGLALGQFLAGSVSDRFGRRPVLLVGVTAYTAVSAVCALSPSIETLVLARLVQGMAGGVGIVIAQAAGRDVFSGPALIRFYGRLTITGGLAAVVGPVIGGQLARTTDWRGMFVFLSAVGAVLLAVCATRFPETLPAEDRTTGGVRESIRVINRLADDRSFVGAVLNQGLMYAALFAYLAGATYVLQDGYGLSPQQYALAFGANSAGFMVFGWAGGRLAERWSVRGTVALGGAMSGAGAVGLLVVGLSSPSLPVVLVSLFVLAAGVALGSPAATTLALADHPEVAGTASSLLGMVRFGLGGVSAPLVGLGGPADVLPLGLVATGAVAAAVAAALYSRPDARVDGAGERGGTDELVAMCAAQRS